MKTIRLIGKLFRFILYSLVLTLAVTIILMLLFGLKLFCVQTGSMEPEYPVGSLIVVRPVEFKELKEGDVITFHIGNDTVVTHRLIEIDKKTKQLTTKGDNNNVIDASTVSYDSVIGKVVFHLPGVGYAILLLNTRFSRIMVIIAAVALIGIFVIKRIYYRYDEDDENEESEKKDDEASESVVKDGKETESENDREETKADDDEDQEQNEKQKE